MNGTLSKSFVRLCKTGGAVLDYLFDLFAGEYDKDLNELLKKHTCCAALLPWAELEWGCRQGVA